jgi:hypothetical protein
MLISLDEMLPDITKLITQQKFSEALNEYNKFQEKHPTAKISANRWNLLCWEGALYGFANEVIDACEQAVMMGLFISKNEFRDSRGLARAMTGNYTGAIEDFESYVLWSKSTFENDMYKKRGYKREQWIEALKGGRNPFDPATLEDLRKE